MVQRFPPDRRMLRQVPNLLLGTGVGIGAGSTIVLGGHRVWGTLLMLVGLACLIGIALVVRLCLVSVRLDDDVLIAPRALGGHTRLALRTVTGLGMQYTTSGRASGWKPWVWPGEGDRVRLRIAPPPYAAPPGKRSAHWLPDGVAPPLDWNYLSETPAGEALRTIGDRVRAVQGRYGAWQESHRETELAYARVADTAYWAPDGRIGLLPGARVS